MTRPIDVVVVTYNSEKFVPRLAASLGHAGVDSIVIVDNSPGEAVAEAVASAEWSPLPTLIRRPDNPGFGSAINVGVAHGCAPYVALVNPDVIVDGADLEALRAELEVHERVAVIGAQLVTSTGQPVSSARNFPTLASLARTRPVDVVHRGATVPADWICGALMLWRRDSFEALGGFDDGYFLYYEDVDICRRARDAGLIVLIAGGLTVVHDQGHGEETSPYLRSVDRRSRRRYARRWLGISGVVAARIADLTFFLKRCLKAGVGRLKR